MKHINLTIINFSQCCTKVLSILEIFETFQPLWKQTFLISHYACLTLRGNESFPPVVIYLTFLQHILRISHSGKVALWNSQIETTIYTKFLRKQNSINIIWTCRLKVFSSRNSYDICWTIWTHKFLRTSYLSP